MVGLGGDRRGLGGNHGLWGNPGGCRGVVVLVAGLLSVAVEGAVPSAWAWDSGCEGLSGDKCIGYEAARRRWNTGAEHSRIWLASRSHGKLPAELDRPIFLTTFVGGDTVSGGLSSLRPVLTGAKRIELRRVSIPELTQLPDFSYALYDWGNGNEGCPPDETQDPLVCHDFNKHMGVLNSSHFVPQAEYFYRYYHQLALTRAMACRELHDQTKALQSRFEPYVLACEQEALALEAVGQHYLQDAWSMGHMWERWGGPELSDFNGSRSLGLTVALVAGSVHGAKNVLEEKFPLLFPIADDPLCGPRDEIRFVMRGATNAERGAGDLFWNLLSTDATYDTQWRTLLRCAIGGMREVYEATAQQHGLPGTSFPSPVDPLDPICWQQRATNLAMYTAIGFHTGMQPDQKPVLGRVEKAAANVLLSPLDVLWVAVGGSQTVVVFAGDLPVISAKQVLQLRRDLAALHVKAALLAKENPTGTQAARARFAPLVGISANSAYLRRDKPATWVEPSLPWTVGASGPEGDRKETLALLFADAHAADRCESLSEAQLLQYQERVASFPEDGDPEERKALCEQCVQMVAPHLRHGENKDNYDKRREALCGLNGSSASFVYTGEDATMVTGEETVDHASLVRATTAWCCAGKFYELRLLEGPVGSTFSGAQDINHRGQVVGGAFADDYSGHEGAFDAGDPRGIAAAFHGHGFLWDVWSDPPRRTDLGWVERGNHGQAGAYGIDDQGTVAGSSTWYEYDNNPMNGEPIDSGSFATVWRAGQGLKKLPVPDGYQIASALAVTSDGFILGTAQQQNGTDGIQIRWNASSGMVVSTAPGPIGSAGPLAQALHARRTNRAGQTLVPVEGDGMDGLRDPAGSTKPLLALVEDPGTWSMFRASAINEFGEIVGSGMRDTPFFFGFVMLPPDFDGDRVGDATEVALGTDLTEADTDGDGMDDGEELREGTDPLEPGQ